MIMGVAARKIYETPARPVTPREFVYREFAFKPPSLTRGQHSFVHAHLPKRPRLVEERTPAKEIAGVRIREYLFDLGREMRHEFGWMAHAARKAGLNYATARKIIRGDRITVGPDVVDQISLTTGCSVSIFYDLEVR
jgi:hypothetical protein